MGSGGGSSGKVDYPTYIKEVHEDWLRGSSSSLSTDITTVMDAAIGASPWAGELSYDPTTALASMATAVGGMKTLIDAMTYDTDWNDIIDLVIAKISDADFISAADDVVAAKSAEIDADISNSILPRFQRGMQDVNAVMSSAFVIGQALIEAEGLRQKASFSATIRLQDRSAMFSSGLELVAKLYTLKFEEYKFYVSTVVESKRIEIVAKKEQEEGDQAISEKDALWDLGVFEYGGKLLAAVHGGVASNMGQSKLQSAIGGALSLGALGMQLGSGGGSSAAFGGLGALMGGLFAFL